MRLWVKYNFQVLALLIFAFGFSTICNAQKVSTYDGSVLYICVDSTVSVIGNNKWYQLGDGTNIERHTPVKLKGLRHIVAVNALGSIALLADGTVWKWAWKYSQTHNNTYDLKKIDIDSVVAISVGMQTAYEYGHFYCALKSDGTVWCWSDIQTPSNWWGYDTSIVKLNIPKVKEISAGNYCAIALCEDGSVYTWGLTLINGNGITRYTNDTFNFLVPRKVMSISNAVHVVAGYQNVFAIKSDGTLWGWGQYFIFCDSCGYSIPVQLKITDVASFYTGINYIDYAYALKQDGTFAYWYSKTDGSGYNLLSEPILVKTGKNIIDIATSSLTTLPNQQTSYAIDNYQNLWRWGNNTYGQLGNLTTYRVDTPEIMPHSCLNVDCDTITKNPDILKLDTTVFPNDNITLTASASNVNLYWWYPGENIISGRNSQQATVFIKDSTQIEAVISDSYGCLRIERFILRRKCSPITKIVLDTATYPGAKIKLSADTGLSYLWQPTINLSCYTCKNPVAHITDSITYMLTLDDTFKCAQTNKYIIRIRNCDTIEKLALTIKLDTVINYTSDIPLHATKSYSSYSWSPIKGLNCDTCQNPILTTNSSGNYFVEITDSVQCPFQEEFKITLQKLNVDIPNLFSPNNDGINDYFEIKGLAPGSTLRVYDSNGLLIFSSENYQGNWDGRQSDGTKLSEGTYWYILNIPPNDSYKGWVYLKR